MKHIPNFNNKYLVSEDGLTVIGTGRIKKPHTLFADKNGYMKTNLYKPDGRRVNVSVHRLVAMTYISNPDDKPCVNHINGIKNDNRIENLEWCTYSENEKHKYLTGLGDNAKKLLSERNKLKPKSTFSDMGKGNRKLSDDDIRTIRHLANTKQKTYKELALMYNYDSSSIGKIVRRQRYSDVE